MRRLALLILACSFATPAHAGEAEQLFERVRPSVVTITALDEQQHPEGEGSGVVVGPGQVATNCHVVEDAAALRVRSGDKEFAAAVVSGDLKRDLCRLEVKELTAPAVAIRASDDLKPGEAVFAVGNPLGFGLAVGSGLVSAVKRSGDDIRIYTSVPTSPGSSGGGLFDAQGRLVGVVTARYFGAQNFNMALPAEWVAELLKNGAAWKTVPKVEPDPGWVDKAELLREGADWTKLEEFARRWQGVWPTSAEADEYLGLALINQKHYREAETELTKALVKDPLRATAHCYRAIVRREAGDKTGAYEDIRRAQALIPSSGYFLRISAFWLKQDGDTGGALSAVRDALRREPWDPITWEALGELLQERKEFREAEEAFRVVLRLKPNDPVATGNLAALQAFLGNTDAARRTLTKDSPSTTNTATTWASIGSTEGKNKRFAESETAYRKALELNPGLAEAWMGLGATLRATGRPKEAEAALRKALQLNPGLAGAWLNLGGILGERDDMSGARDAYEKATKADSTLAPAWHSLGSLQYNQKAMADAAQSFSQVVRLEPKNTNAWAHLGDALAVTGQRDKGVEALRTAEELDPKNEFMLQAFTRYYGLTGDEERALAYAERALALNAASPNNWSNKGYSLLRLKRYPEAAAAFETAIRLQPDFANAWINLGEANLRQGQMGKAIVALEKALALQPTAVDARLYVVQGYAMTRQFDKAQSHLNILESQSPKVPAVWSLQTALFLERNKKLEALAAYGSLKALNPAMARDLRERFLKRGKQYELPE